MLTTDRIFYDSRQSSSSANLLLYIIINIYIYYIYLRALKTATYSLVQWLCKLLTICSLASLRYYLQPRASQTARSPEIWFHIDTYEFDVRKKIIEKKKSIVFVFWVNLCTSWVMWNMNSCVFFFQNYLSFLFWERKKKRLTIKFKVYTSSVSIYVWKLVHNFFLGWKNKFVTRCGLAWTWL